LPSSSAIKSQVRRLLAAPDLVFAQNSWPVELEGLAAKPLLRALLSGLSAPQEDERWRAVGLLGLLVARLAKGDLDVLREVLRRLMWGLNEESGAILWAAPQAMGEVLYQAPVLAGEFGKILRSYLEPEANFLEHPPLQAGTAWGWGRLALVAPEVIRAGGGGGRLLPLLALPLAQARGCAAWALGVLAEPSSAPALAGLQGDSQPLRLLLDGRLQSPTVGRLASWALTRCASN
jgi:hypothetical protein